MKQFQKLSPGG